MIEPREFYVKYPKSEISHEVDALEFYDLLSTLREGLVYILPFLVFDIPIKANGWIINRYKDVWTLVIV